MEEALDGECLFSFELFIKRIEYVTSPCYVPAVAFRLLDYPTVITYFTSLVNIENIRQKLNCGDKEEDLHEMNKLKDGYGGFDFKKGKSCLFRDQFSSLNSSLQNVPLYVMLLDYWSVKPKLIGSCTIPLCELVVQIKNGFKQFGKNCPAVGHASGKFDMCNLMGASISKISLELKLTCYGESLLRHVQLGTRKKSQIDVLLNLDTACEQSIIHDEEKRTNDQANHIIVPPNGSFIQNEELWQGTTNTKEKSVVDVTTQCSSKVIKKRHNRRTHSYKDQIFSNEHVICPPPLCLNLHDPMIERACHSLKKPEKKENCENLLETYDEISSDEELQIEILKPVRGGKYYQVIKKNGKAELTCSEKVGKLKNTQILDTDRTNNEATEYNNINISCLNELPILAGLLKEITNLTSALKVFQDNTQNNQLDTKIVPVSEKEIIQANSIPYPESPHVISHARTENIQKQVDKKPKLNPRKERRKKLPPKNKLTYGFTKTQRLRYNLTHQNEPLPQSSIELHDNSNSQFVEVNLPQLNNIEVNEYSEAKKPSHLQMRTNFDFIDRSIVSDDQYKNVESPEYKQQQDNAENNEKSSVSNQQRVTIASDVEVSFHGQSVDLPQQTGFHKPVEPRVVSLSELGIFDDQSPWTSVVKSDENLNEYDDDSFHSDGSDETITVTSSVTLPDVSDVSDVSDNNAGGLILAAGGVNSMTSSQISFQRSVSRDRASSSSPTKTSRGATYKSKLQSRESNSSSSAVNPLSRITSQTSSSVPSKERTHSESSNISSPSQSSSKEALSKKPKQSNFSPIKSKAVRKKMVVSDEKLLKQSVPSINSSESLSNLNSITGNF